MSLRCTIRVARGAPNVLPRAGVLSRRSLSTLRPAAWRALVPAVLRLPLLARGVATAAQPQDHVNHNFKHTESGLYVDRSMPPTFQKILIANRGEIACRVMRTCKELGIKTVAIYSDADAKAMHVQMADEAYRVGAAPANQSYLLGDKIIEIAKRSGAQAIHPGYGFLSENAEFAAACDAAGVTFIGPPASAIHAMGSKSASKKIMTDAHVPVVPGYHGEAQDFDTLSKEAEKCGYPIMLKAIMGGGGKGMRIVRRPEELPEALEACKREALNSFKNDKVLLERYIERPRHIEFQVFADKHGNAVHLFERDCSVQRRHQKVLEEAPAPGMISSLRDKMGQSAVDAAKAVGYVGAGTVEFIFDADRDDYYFMEMNTRLQVEHPVTEMLMRRDLVQWQLHVAAGHKLPVEQSVLNKSARGHAIEARIYAENPYNNFLPATGRLTHLRSPALAPDCRVETGVREGDEVSIFYDPMIAKLCVWGPDRPAALKRLSIALQDYQIIGPPNNISFLQKAVNHPEFAKGRVTTGFIAAHLDELVPRAQAASPDIAGLATLALLMKEQRESECKAAGTADRNSLWNQPSAFRLNHSNNRTVTLLKTNVQSSNEEENKQVPMKVDVETRGHNTYVLSVDGQTLSAQVLSSDARSISAVVGERVYKATIVPGDNGVHVVVDGVTTQFKLPETSFGTDSGRGGAGSVAPMAGKVVKVLVEPDQVVKKGTSLMIMEAMKMEHIIKAPKDGVVEKVLYQPGDFVEGGKVVVSFAETEAERE